MKRIISVLHLFAFCQFAFSQNIKFHSGELQIPNGIMKSITINKDSTNIVMNTIDGIKINGVSYEMNTNHLDPFDIKWGRMTHVSVKKDGTGDYTSIQVAINSITDATENNQYCIDVYDDFIVNDLKDLWLANAPTYQNSSDSPSQPIALFITKNWVHVRGIGRRKLTVVSPNTSMAGTCFQNIQVIAPHGNSIIDNFDVEIKGGRYAIHQESGGSSESIDYMATTIYKNLNVRHWGNSSYTNGSSWTTTCAQANGTSGGSEEIYINCHWYSDESKTPFYVHAFPMSDSPNRLVFIGCSVDAGIEDKSLISCNFGGNNSLQKNQICIYGSDFRSFDALRVAVDSTISDARYTNPYNKQYIPNSVVGFGNKKHMVNRVYFRTLRIAAKNDGDSISVIGGTAKDLIFGNSWMKHNGVANSDKGYEVGDIYLIKGTTSHAQELPYLLGNCAAENKTLIVRVMHPNTTYDDVTIVFDKNYMTSDGSAYTYQTTPAISMDDIISDINSEHSSLLTVSNLWNINICIFDDTKEVGINASNANIPIGSGVVHDYTNGINAWRLASSSERPDGVSCRALAPNETGDIALVSRNTFSKESLGINTISSGQMYKWNGTSWVTTETASEATFISYGSKGLTSIK